VAAAANLEYSASEPERPRPPSSFFAETEKSIAASSFSAPALREARAAVAPTPASVSTAKAVAGDKSSFAARRAFATTVTGLGTFVSAGAESSARVSFSSRNAVVVERAPANRAFVVRPDASWSFGVASASAAATADSPYVLFAAVGESGSA
jgi:hypothetical protein